MSALPEDTRITRGRDLDDRPTLRLDLVAELPNGSTAPVSLVAPLAQMRALGWRLIQEADAVDERQGSLFGARS